MQKQTRLVKFSVIVESDKPIDSIESWLDTQLNILEVKDIISKHQIVRRKLTNDQ